MTAHELRKKYLEFFESKGHKIAQSASLIPANDPTVLFTTAGMQQFKPYYLDPNSAPAQNIVTVQKCIRTSDIDEVGDDTHLTFFEMLGNFSFGGYWKKEAIEYAYDFITKELGLKIDYVSVFEGDDKTPGDLESEKIWKDIDSSLTIKKHSREDNFWGPTGDSGPCGPTTEIYVNGVEIWNIVFNEYNKNTEGKYLPLETKGIDTGMGLDRLTVISEQKKNVFETDLLSAVLNKVKTFSQQSDSKSEKIIADHLRASVFLLADGVIPSNKDRGYILRRLIRRAVTYGQKIGIEKDFTVDVANIVIEIYSSIYPELKNPQIEIELKKEEFKFRTTLGKGLKMLESKDKISGVEAFDLFQSYGFPFELTKEFTIVTDPESFETEFKKHQDLSRTSSAGQFKGGLADHSDKVVRLHTATHLLNAALRKVLGNDVWQKGSNITEERTRFDFTHSSKLTDDQKSEVERLVNDWVKRDLKVKRETMPLDEARKLNAVGVFGEKYPDTVSVYTIYDSATDEVISREFCGGPHVEHTGAIGDIKIQKEEAVSAGVRRIKAIIS